MSCFNFIVAYIDEHQKLLNLNESPFGIKSSCFSKDTFYFYSLGGAIVTV